LNDDIKNELQKLNYDVKVINPATCLQLIMKKNNTFYGYGDFRRPDAFASHGAVSGDGRFHGEVINRRPAFRSSILKYDAQSFHTAIATLISDLAVEIPIC
jgi:hypothetical protein